MSSRLARIARRAVSAGLLLTFVTGVPLTSVAAPPADTTGLDVAPVSPRIGRTDARIRYSITRAAQVRVTILDARGRPVAILADGVQPAGEHVTRWNGLRTSGTPAPSGMYIAHVEAEGASGSRHLILVQ